MMVNELKSDNLSKGVFYVTGIQKLKDRTHIKYTTQEEESFKKLSKDPSLYEKIYKSIAPGICGSE
jgi:DNA replicative helicase MCM subunit Mcm2 (Cdc46/Mcm family)